MKLETLIAEFAAAAGIANPVAVEGVWKFSADGHVFGVVEDGSGRDAWIFGEIPAPSPDREDSFRKAVLEANFFMRGTCGAVFSINPESGAYTLMRFLPLDTATLKEFLAFVEKFVNTLATWKKISDETQDAAEADAPQGPSEAPSRIPPERPAGEDDGAMPIFPGMLRV